MELLGLETIFSLAEGVQGAVEEGKWAYLAVISIFILMQVAKRWSHIKKHAPQYSAGFGALTGAVLSDEPMNGALGGAMVGNAASGLYSLLKPIMGGNIWLILKVVAEGIKKFQRWDQKKALEDFDTAVKKAENEDSTKELEEWMGKNS